MLPKRQHQIVLALIREFINTAEPVGSNTLTRKYNISASPATIRNEMARLESDGFMQQPHTSSGRVPTDKAYRYYVNYLLQQQVEPPRDMQEVLREYEHYTAHVEKLLEHTSKLLADLTHYTSLILAPRIRRTLFRYLRLVPADDSNNVIIILMTNTGTLINKLVQLEHGISDQGLERMTNLLNDRLSGMCLGDIDVDFLRSLEPGLQVEILHQLAEVTRETALNEEGDFICGGTVNLLDWPEFRNLEKLRKILELLEEEKVVAEILNKTLTDSDVKVFIGSEHRLPKASDCTFITAAYRIGSTPVGSIGIMGPTRMNYQRLIPAVRAVAQVFGRKLSTISNP